MPLLNNLRIQILPTIHDLAHARRHQFAAFIASEALLVVWDDEAMHLVERAKMIENELMQLVWQAEIGPETQSSTDEKTDVVVGVNELGEDTESGELASEKRPVHMLQTVIIVLSMALVIAALGAGYRNMVFSYLMDRNYIHFVFALLTPMQIFFLPFFCQVIINSIAQMIGPVSQLHVNSKFYSAIAPRRLTTPTLPHVTIQCPVYKEGLRGVIMPTIRSLRQAISTYEMQGGSANIWLNDDGLQLLDPAQQQERIHFYADNNVGWTARPAAGDKGFTRRESSRRHPT